MNYCQTRLLACSVITALLLAAGCEQPANSHGGSAAATAAGNSAAAVAGATLTAQNVLDKMAAAYRSATTYEDHATAELSQPGSTEPLRVDFSVAFERPNKLRLNIYQGEVVCDGKKWFAYSKEIPGQAVLRDAPKKITLPMLQADPTLNQVLNNGFAGGSPQLLLLLEDKPLPILLDGVRDQDLVLDEPGKIGDYDCYRVRFTRGDGVGEYWIDQKTFVLRGVRFRLAAPPGKAEEPAAEGASMVANFERARLGGAVDEPSAFQYAVPEGTQCHRVLVDPGPYDLVGKKLPEFQLVDMQGKKWSSQSLAGKVVALHLWHSNAEACQPVVPSVQQAYETFKNNDKVSVWAINLDNAQVESKTIEATAKQWNLSVPLLRDPDLETEKLLRTGVLPATFFLDAKGTLQDCIVGSNPVAYAATTRKLEKLLAGEELAKQAAADLQERISREEKEADLVFAGEVQTTTIQQAKAAPPAAKSQPARFHLTTLWKSTAIGAPGNILVSEPAGGKSLIYVVDGFKSIAELGLDGKLVTNHKAKLAEEEIFTLLRTAKGGDGKRYFVAFAPWQQRCHLFDENFKYLLSYPDNALENRHPGLTDVELGDLDGDGKIKVYAGFGRTVGVKCVSIDGAPNWSCRSLFNVTRVLPGPDNAKGQSNLFCISDDNSLAVLDAKGHLRDATRLFSDGNVQALVHANLAESGPEAWCGVLNLPDSQQLARGQFTAFGLNQRGQVTWKYDLPFGALQPVDAIVVGRLLAGPSRQWLLPGSDGSIHVLAADGTLIDRFNYGEQVTGLATVEIDGKPVLLIGSVGGVEALKVD